MNSLRVFPLATFALLVGSARPASNAEAERPNVLFIPQSIKLGSET